MAAQLRTVMSTVPHHPPKMTMASLRPSIQPTTTGSSTLTQALTAPSKVAHMFDWKKSSNTVLTLHVTKDSIECGIASHPTLTTLSSRLVGNESPIKVLPSIPLGRRGATLNRSAGKHQPKKFGTRSSCLLPTPSFQVASVTDALQRIIQDHDVCGVVVVYPTNNDGCNNAACGRTFHILDHITMNNTKPICLYDPNSHHHNNSKAPDVLGRSPLYCTTTTAKVVRCNPKQTTSTVGLVSENDMLQQSWSNFVHQYWPNIIHNTTTTGSTTGSNTANTEYDDDVDDNDLSDFVAKLNRSTTKSYYNHIMSSSTITTTGHQHKQALVYQSAF